MLYGSGAVRTIRPDDIPEAEGDPDYVIDVGPRSAHKALRKLRR